MLPSLLLLVLAAAANVTEPNTAVEFERTMKVGEYTLALTGVDRRRALGRDAYAVAHYISDFSAETIAQAATYDRLDQYIDAPAHKMIIFHGVYKHVPANGIRHSWRKHFKDLGIPPREDFVDAFQSPFARGERIYFIATPEGRLEVRQNDRVLGQWDDPVLVRALWAMCLGPTTEMVDREKLAALNILSADTIAREPARGEPEKETTHQ